MYLLLVQTRVLEDLLHRGEGLLEEVHVEFFELRTGEGHAEVNALVDRLDLLRKMSMIWGEVEWGGVS